jgi:hypothetical protein
MALLMAFTGHSWILRMALGIVVYSGTILLIGPSERTHVLRLANAIWSPSDAKGLQIADFTQYKKAPRCGRFWL